MANISKIKLPGSETIYKLVDTDARKMIENLPSPMVFKGTLGAAEDNPTITELPEASASTVGHTYKVITAGTYAGVAAKIGDVFTCAQTSSVNFHWVYIPSGDEPSGTVTNVAAGVGLSTNDGNPITTSGTLNVVAFTGATAETAGAIGGVPAPSAGDEAKYLQANGTWSTVDALPTQIGMSGKFLTTDGSSASWATVDALPSQSGHSGEYLTTDGSSASWSAIDLSTKADIAAPELTTKTVSETTYYPRAVTIGGASNPDLDDNSENIATTKWVQNLINKLVGYNIDEASNTLSVSPLDSISNNQLTLISDSATIEQISGDEYSFNITV